jgi:hypothetical protein
MLAEPYLKVIDNLGGGIVMTRSRPASAIIVSAVLAAALVGLPHVSAHAAVTECPTSLPTADAVDGLTGTGYSVERGTSADPFTARVLGRITDGIAPGIDMIMADLDSPALTRAGGVWSGMSGSPVYAPDGRLIGSVSYGLAASSPIAGLTPAEDLTDLLNRSAARTRIAVSTAAAKRIARTGNATAAEASAGFRQLPMPVSVSGASRNSTKFLKPLRATPGVQVRTNGARITAAAASPSEISAGSNFAAALSYGDVSIAGVGTTTFVCDGHAVAFGHPFFALGSVEYTAHPASAVYVQPDLVNGPFKVANPGGPVGVVSQDRLTGLRAELGAEPTGAFPITTSLVPDGGATVTGRTTGIYQPYSASLAALHLQASIIKALGAQGPGSAALKFTIKGRTAAGSPFTLVRSDHYADTVDLPFAAANDLFTVIQPLVDQSFKDVSITSVDVTGTVSGAIKQYRVTAIKMYKNGRWVPQRGGIVTSAGKTVYRQVTLTKYRSSQTVIAKLRVKVPARSRGAVGSLTISNGPAATLPGGAPKSLTGLLKQLAGYPTSDAVAGTLSLDNGGAPIVTLTLAKVDATVAEYLRDLNVQVNP